MSEVTDDRLNLMIDRKVRQIEMGYERKFKEVKPFVFDLACEFV